MNDLDLLLRTYLEPFDFDHHMKYFRVCREIGTFLFPSYAR